MVEYTGFAGPDGASKDPDSSGIFILPVPYDNTSTWIKGADKGPLALLEASAELEMLDIETGYEVSGRGIYTCPPVEAGSDKPEDMVRKVEQEVSGLIGREKFVVTLGGEHSVSIGAVRAHASAFPGMGVLQLDAHADLRDEYKGSRFNHACVMARVREMCPAVQAGVRSMSSEELPAAEKGDMFYAHEILSCVDWVRRVVEKLPDKVYVSIDLDVLDPSIMPSTGTPQPGGLDWYRVMSLLSALAEKKEVVGFDVVELCPNGDNKAPDLLAAKLVYKFLSYIFVHK